MAQPMGGAEGLVDSARLTARDLLGDQEERLAHVEAVGRRAESVARRFSAGNRAQLVAAAYLHDIGYAPRLRATGLHPLDGARWLRDRGVDPRVCNLVAHHSGARFEAAERGLLGELEGFELEDGPGMDALVFADMTTAPDGRYVTFEQRMDDIMARYLAGDPVHRAMVRGRPVLRGSVDRTMQRLRATAHPM
jgi:putative nucleotidyltransferase with HDIG domain